MGPLELPYAKAQRMRLIDFLLAEYGTINRSALVDFFAISVPQASDDLAVYQQIAPLNMAYCKSEKTYKRTADFVRIYP